MEESEIFKSLTTTEEDSEEYTNFIKPKNKKSNNKEPKDDPILSSIMDVIKTTDIKSKKNKKK